MRGHTIAAGILALALASSAAGCGRRGEAPAPSPAPATLSSPGVLQVDELMEHVDRHRGPVTVEGVVRSVSPETGALSLIDAGEFRECGTTECARWVLPVRWAGAMPAARDLVRLEGVVVESSGKLSFAAKALKASPPEHPR